MQEHIATVRELRARAYCEFAASQYPGEFEGRRMRVRALDAALGAMSACDDPQTAIAAETPMNDPNSQSAERLLREAMAAGRPTPSASEMAALTRLVTIAKGDSGQCRRVANFLLAWWNADTCGGFDLTDLWAVDTAIAADMVIVVGMIARVHSYPNAGPFALDADFRELVRDWRPDLFGNE